MVPWIPSVVMTSADPSPQTGWLFLPKTTSNWTNPFNVNCSQTASGLHSAVSGLGPYPQSCLATLEIVGDNAWYLDSGATNHLIHTVALIGENTSYNGPGKVYVSNGNRFPVMSTGQSSLLM